MLETADASAATGGATPKAVTVTREDTYISDVL